MQETSYFIWNYDFDYGFTHKMAYFLKRSWLGEKETMDKREIRLSDSPTLLDITILYKWY